MAFGLHLNICYSFKVYFATLLVAQLNGRVINEQELERVLKMAVMA